MVNKKDVTNNKFEYFLNAIHYCIYLEEVWSNKKINKVMDKVFPVIFRIPFINKYQKKMNKRQKDELEKFQYGKNFGLSIWIAHCMFGHFYSCYSLFISFVLVGLVSKEFDNLSKDVAGVIIGIPICLCYIPAYKALFTKDRYLKYFKKFEKKDKQWHRKWKRITVAFCVGSIVAFFMGIGMLIIILLK